MALKREQDGGGGVFGAGWRAFCRATELPGEHCLPDTLRRARAASGRGDPESQWALRQYEALRQSLEHEKQALTRLLAATGLTFWGALALGARRESHGAARLIAPLNALLALALAVRALRVNLLLRNFWERPADD